MRDIAAERLSIDAAINGKTLCSALAETAAARPDAEALKWRDADGAWRAHTWSEYRARVRNVALGLRELGFRPGDFATMLCRNRPEYVFCDQGTVHAGGTPVGLYNTLSPEQIAYIVGHCQAKVAFVEDASFLEKLLKVRGELPLLEKIVIIDPSADVNADGLYSLVEVEALGAAAHERDALAFDNAWQAVKPDDILTLIYTSGTTGPPKAVMLSHRNVLWDIEAIGRMMMLTPEDRLISYLPLAHAADRFLTMFQGAVRGFTVHYCPDLTQLLTVLVETRPTFFGAVPRVWEKLHAGINAAIARESDEQKRAIVGKALEAGRAATAARQSGTPVPAEVQAAVEAMAPVYNLILQKVGLDQVRHSVCGAAPTPLEVLEFFDAIGLTISEVWGMSELSAVATMNPIGAERLGSVGVPLEGVELEIAEDGELLVRGGLVMQGYYRDQEKTAETVMPDGWLRTGDVATVDQDGYYRIVDRKKELIITAGGKNISPANLESLLKEHPIIGQACVIGDNKPYLSALIVLDGEVAPLWAQSKGIDAATIADLARHPDVHAEVERAIHAVNDRVARVENIRRWTLLDAEWTAESEELTPTMKLKRRVIGDKYAEEIDKLYG